MVFRLLAVALAFSSAASAQSLVGRVVDAESDAPLAGAAIQVPALDRGAATGADGTFELLGLPHGDVRVVVSFLGYLSQTRTVAVGAGPARLDVALAPSIVESPDVTVTARARASDVLSVPQSVAVVDRAELDRAGGATPFEALDDLAGVRLLETGPGIAKPVVRGLTSQRVLIVNDGVRQEGQGWGDEHGPEIGAADVDRIEVVRGPLSLLYGSDALGGVVQTTPTPLFAHEGETWGTATIAEETAAQQTQGTLAVGGRSDDLAGEVRLGGLGAAALRTPDGLIPNTALDTRTASARFGARIGEGTLEGGASAFRQTIGLFEAEDAAVLPASLRDRGAIALPRQTVEHDRAVLRLDQPLGADRLDVVGAVQQNRRREFEDEEGPIERSSEAVDDPALFLRLTTATLDARLHHRPVGRVFGTVGVSGLWQRNETLAEEALIPGGTTLNGAVYVAEQLVAGPVTVDAGARVDVRQLDVEANDDLGVEAQTRSYTALTGAVGAAWQVGGGLSVAANLGRAFRAPILQELFGNGVHEGTLRFERGTATLAPETSVALDGVVRYLSPHVYAEAGAFLNVVDAYITPRASGAVDPESGFQIYDFVQTDARLAGIEARVDVHPHALHGLGLHLAGDWTRGTERASGDPLPFVPPARLDVAVEYQVERAGVFRDVEARVGPMLVAAQDRPELSDEIPTASYAVWSASVSASLTVGGAVLTPTLAVENIGDARYVDPLSRYRPFGVPAAGRSVRLALRAAF
ncbi:TonB-dependent receptor [Rubrivirga sp. IMCC43871]|uniref:TonB-dependent receptor n=1 Tax=Rubrivirga sp. IMCC43871 TaxID=3391575 RepID=UPI00398FD16C